MGKTAIEVLRDEAEWAEDKVLYSMLDHFSENLDSLPVSGLGLGFVQRSVEKQAVKRVEDDLVPVIEEHLEVQLRVVEALASGEGEDEIREEYGERLLDTNPLWETLEGEEARDDLLEADIDACRQASSWIRKAEGEFEDIADLADALGKEPEEAADDIEPLIEYLPELLQEHREDMDLSSYSSVLESEKVRKWFLDHLIEGLEQSQEEALEELEERIEEGQAG
ncbi:MAG: hypothetical protein SVS85_02480 [Candidatus Nanohaloarchaea archaeon]|nr:hypothetical protein [Candidatus Nanohaloarchaea archaeon]